MRQPFWHPIFRSRRFGHRRLRGNNVIAIGFLTVLMPPIFAAAILLPIALILDWGRWTFEISNASFLGEFAILVAYSPFVSFIAVPIALLLGAFALRIGFAGWGVALCTALMRSALLGFGAMRGVWSSDSVTATSMLAMISNFHAAAMWIATRRICPDALLPDETA